MTLHLALLPVHWPWELWRKLWRNFHKLYCTWAGFLCLTRGKVMRFILIVCLRLGPDFPHLHCKFSMEGRLVGLLHTKNDIFAKWEITGASKLPSNRVGKDSFSIFLGHTPNIVVQSSKADDIIKTTLVATYDALTMHCHMSPKTVTHKGSTGSPQLSWALCVPLALSVRTSSSEIKVKNQQH